MAGELNEILHFAVRPNAWPACDIQTHRLNRSETTTSSNRVTCLDCRAGMALELAKVYDWLPISRKPRVVEVWLAR